MKLRMPEGWWPINSKDWDDSWSEPSILWAPSQPHPTLIVRAWCDSGVYGYSGLLLFEKQGSNWLLKGKPIEFSDRGGFQLVGNKLRVWDMDYQPSKESHNSPHGYWLQEYVAKSSRLVLTRARHTKRKYALMPNEPPRMSQDDPLREFGLKWTRRS